MYRIFGIVSVLQRAICACLALLACGAASGQFVDNFDGPGIEGWSFMAGDGTATMDFRHGKGYGEVRVDSTRDRRNIWWALIKRSISREIDVAKLARPGYELRMEARIRVSNPPKRVNLCTNTQRTTDFDTNLMEFDIPDTNWHTIYMTTHGFDVRPGDTVNVQMALMDWGIGKYGVDIDYYKADVVEAAHAGPDSPLAVPYRPPVPPLSTFKEKARAVASGTIDLQYPEVNFDRWSIGKARVMSVNGTQWAILRWDLSAYKGREAVAAGILELPTHSVAATPSDLEEFGLVRVCEILAGDPKWDPRTVTLESLRAGRLLDEVVNTQMIIDVHAGQGPDGRTLATISRPVLQRLLEGKTLGIAIKPLGSVNANFAREGATLHFNLK